MEAVNQGSMADEDLSDDDILQVMSTFWWGNGKETGGGGGKDGNTLPPSKPIDQKLIWENYRDELFSFLKRGGDVSGMQLMRNPIRADWDTDASKLYAMANRISAWGVEYSPRKDISVPSQYGLFLKSINIDTSAAGGANPAIATAQAAYDAAVSRLAEVRKTCKERYETRTRSMPYEDFESSTCRFVSNAESDVAMKEFDLQLAKMQSAGPNADLADARAKFADDDGSFSWKESFMSNLQRFKTRVNEGNANSFSISVSKRSQSTATKKEWAQLETMSDFVTFEDEDATQPKKPSVTTNKFEFTTSADKFKMDIRALGYANIQVDPESWFSHSVLSSYKKGPFTGKTNFFGKKGTFNQMLKSLYVLYKPSVSLYVEEDDALSLKVLSMESTIKLGPFSADKVIVSDKPTSNKLYKVDFVVSSEEPIVVAIDNHLF